MGRRRLLLLALIAGLVGAGYLVRSELGIEFSRESVESLVSGLGWKAPALFVGLVSFRQFLALPSMVVLSAGGAVTFYVSTCPPRPGDIYAMLGSFSGTSPGIDVGPFVIPLNFDPYFMISVTAANTYPFVASSAFLDGNGEAQAQFGLVPGTDPTLAGITLYHAFVIVDLATLTPIQVSEPDSITLGL